MPTDIKIDGITTPGDYKITVLNGEANKPIERSPISVTGNMYAPAEWASKQAKCFDATDAYIEVSEKDRSLTLRIWPDMPYGVVVTGKMNVHPHLLDLRLGEGWGDPAKLGEFFRRRRRYFVNEDEGAKLILGLKNFNAKVKSEVDKVDDKSAGRFRQAVDKFVEHSLPREFSLSMPIIEGQEPVTFKVDLFVDVRDAGCTVSLDSVEVEEIMEIAVKSVMDSEISKFDPGIVVIRL